ncbi:inositol monophosphatase family protein [Bacillus velezensis]|nr:inositol monophosphatase family protein [Bacillus velezensis]
MTNWTEIDDIAKQWVKEAGTRIRQSMQESLTIETKSNPNDLVTNIDKETERFFIDRIQELFPDTGFSEKKGREISSAPLTESSGSLIRLTER